MAFLEITQILTFVMSTEDFCLLQYNAVQSDVSEELIRWTGWGSAPQNRIVTVSVVKGSYPANVGYYFALLLQIPRS
jgi:hypothetical protein